VFNASDSDTLVQSIGQDSMPMARTSLDSAPNIENEVDDRKPMTSN